MPLKCASFIRAAHGAAAAVALLALCPQFVDAAPPMAKTDRERVNFDADWRFLRSAPVASQSGLPITDWGTRSTPGNAADAEMAAMSAPTFDSTTGGWTNIHTGNDAFNGRAGFAYFRATLPALPQANRIINFDGVDDNATVYLNGVKLTHHEGWDEPFTVALDSAWKVGDSNVLIVLVENTAGAGGITGAVTVGNRTGAAQGGEFSAENVNDSAWRVVHLPHDYVVEGTFDQHLDAGHAALPTPAAWYRKTFTLPASDRGKAVWVDFDGAYRDATVWLNGVLLGNHPSGYTGFCYDLTRAARFGGKNVLAVHVNPHKAEGWWYEGGGLYRHVWLNVANDLHLAPDAIAVTTQMPEPGADGKAPLATVKASFSIDVPRTISDKFSAAFRILGPEGNAVATSKFLLGVKTNGDFVPSGVFNGPVPTFLKKTVTAEADIQNPSLWSTDAPHLYTLETTLLVDGKPVDTVRTPFGVRTIRFDAEKGFFLNGKSVKIQGTCNHQDFIGVGTAMPDSVLYWRVKKLKEMGCNAIRMSHNPPAPEFLDACDKLGVLVMDENRHLGDTQNPKTGKGTPTTDLSDLRDLILRDRNHPSIIMWSMCNEEPLQGTADGKRIFSAMMDEVHKWDTTRPITCAMNGGWGSGISDVEDLQGINYAPGAYDGFHQKFPTKPLYGSETASTVSARGNYEWEHWDRYYGNREKAFVNAYDVNAPGWAQTAEEGWRPIAERAYVAGGYVWTGFDYKGEPTPFGWPDINSNFGLLDMCGFPKDGFYYYQSVWVDKPMVHLLPHWNWAGKEGQPIRVWAYGTGDRVELTLNGKVIGSQPMPKYGHVEWSVPYAPGKLEAKCYAGDKQVATDVVETTGPPAALRLSTDRTTLLSDGEDVTMVEVDVVDDKGRIVPTATNSVTFAAMGAAQIAGVGNGDPTCHEPDKASLRSAFAGKCMVLVGQSDKSGKTTLTASAPGLKSATLSLTTNKP